MDPARMSSLTLDEAARSAARGTSSPARIGPAWSWERACLAFQPSVRVVRSAWPVLELWEARKTSREQINVNLVDRPQGVLVLREGVRVRCELIDAPQAEALSALMSGVSLGELCEQLTRCSGLPASPTDTSQGGAQAGDPPPVRAWFSRWAGLGLIVAEVS
jgi:hypothetical protein